MGRGQWPRQVLIWTLPAVAVLISFLWFKRRKTALQSDPGGTLTTPQRCCASELLDTNCKSSNTSIATADTQQVIAAFEKAARDVETLRAIQEVVSVEEEEEQEELSVIKLQTPETSQQVITIDDSVSDNIEESLSEIKEIVSEKFLGVTSTPLSHKADKQADIAAIDSSIILVVDSPKTDVSNSELDTILDCKTSNDNSLFTSSLILVKEEAINNKTIVDNSTTDQSDVKSNATFDLLLDKTVTDDIVNGVDTFKKDLNEESINGSPICNNDNKANKCGRKNLNKKSTNRKLSESNNVSNKTKDTMASNKIKLNNNTSKSEKEVMKTNRKNRSATTAVAIGNIVNEIGGMELSCTRVENLGHHISTSTIISENAKTEAANHHSSSTQSPTTTSNVETGERDSANHSPAPAEVMLASPSSMSNFSDAHSEGSSDSGKGCSDIPENSTPPAGGSSLSGDVDVTPAVYEFIIPQHMVGRLIGRYGSFLQDIRSKTHTHVFIKRHPETIKLKICAIEGAQQDIDSALEMIRQKFPLRRFPNLSLEKVTFVNITSSMCPLPQEQFQLQLIEGVNNDVILSSLVTAGHFFLQQPTHPSYSSLCQLNMCMNSVYSSPEAPPLDTPLKDAICAAPAMEGWYRAQIIHLNEDMKTVDVRFMDYGGYLTLETSSLRKIRGDLMLLPFQAVECLLANVLPASVSDENEEGEWSEEARLFVQQLTCGQIVQAQVSQYTEQGIPLVFLYAMQHGQVVRVNDELVNSGFAKAYLPEPETMDMVTEE